MTPWLTIIGIGEDGWDGLSAKARNTIQSVQHIIGSTRTLAMMPELAAKQHEWPQPFSAVVDQLKPLHGHSTVILATGDPMNYGVARKILTFIPKSDVTIITHLSAFSLAAARMGWSLPDCDCFTIHGRPAANVEAFIQPEAQLLILTENETSIAEVCRRLVQRGFEKSVVTVLENMGGPKERITSFAANSMPSADWSPLNSLAVHCKPSPGAKIWSRVAGLPDEAFLHDGKITKREVRAATLAALGPAPDQILWDVGAGSGSIGIEWMRSTRGCEAYAIEPLADRRTMIATNADQLGTPRLHIIPDAAPEAYAGLPRPHAVFIGGGISNAGTFEGAWDALQSGGTMVANVVTIEGEMHLYDLQDKYGGELVRMETSTLTKVGPHRALKPRMAVTQWRVSKP
jgi:precorrin-6B C5,15-methyltransferase / cobalt-precorrin-6B C5,C15-methyltransferase